MPHYGYYNPDEPHEGEFEAPHGTTTEAKYGEDKETMEAGALASEESPFTE